MRRFLAAAIVCLAASLAQAAEPTGFVELLIQAPHQVAPIEGAVWYPSQADGTITQFAENPVFQGVTVRKGARVAPGRHPIVLLSHGLGGNFRTLSWLAVGLAQRGAVVVAVNHPGSTTKDLEMMRSMHHWTRVQDLQAALALLMTDPRFLSNLDPARIYAAGFSFGGWTALSMAGLTGDATAYASHCDATGAKSTHCADLARANFDLHSLNAESWNRSYKDRRIQAVAAIDPALHYGLNAVNVRDLVPNVLLIGLGTGADRLLATNFSSTGSNFAALVPAAKVVTIAPASHFTALLACKTAGASILADEKDDPVCTDPVGTEREAVHGKIVDAIAQEFGLD